MGNVYVRMGISIKLEVWIVLDAFNIRGNVYLSALNKLRVLIKKTKIIRMFMNAKSLGKVLIGLIIVI